MAHVFHAGVPAWELEMGDRAAGSTPMQGSRGQGGVCSQTCTTRDLNATSNSTGQGRGCEDGDNVHINNRRFFEGSDRDWDWNKRAPACSQHDGRGARAVR